jgi:hypothetical protein
MQAISLGVALAAVWLPFGATPVRGDNSRSFALIGSVGSAEEALMEGVLVSTRKAGAMPNNSLMKSAAATGTIGCAMAFIWIYRCFAPLRPNSRCRVVR